MLIFIKNSPRAYAWGSTDALPDVLEQPQTGEPQAELWLGDHHGDPAQVAGDLNEPMTVIDLIDQNPDVYGVDGGHLPFLLKVLGIGAPLSLQVHPRLDEARRGFEREEASGLPVDDARRSYKDRNHKPELLVALTEVRALCGFRDLAEVQADVSTLAAALGCESQVSARGLESFLRAVDAAVYQGEERGRDAVLDWIFSSRDEVGEAVAAVAHSVACDPPAHSGSALDPARRDALRELVASHPGDPGVLVSLLMHVVVLEPYEALYLDAGQLHAYLRGVGVEVMASSDNVLRAGLTEKHVNVTELRRILDLSTSDGVLFPGVHPQPGLTTWQPPVPDFVLHRICVASASDEEETAPSGHAPSVTLDAQYPLVMIATSGVLRVERVGVELSEVASVRKGHSLYISAGGCIEFSGAGEAFVASVGDGWASDISDDLGVSSPSSSG